VALVPLPAFFVKFKFNCFEVKQGILDANRFLLEPVSGLHQHDSFHSLNCDARVATNLKSTKLGPK